MKSQGFTLIEVLVVTGLVAILVVLGSGIFLSNSRFYENQTGEVISINATREAADRLGEMGREAAAFVASYIYDSVTYTSGTQTVVFQLPALNSSGEVISLTYDYAIITTVPSSSNKLELIVAPNALSSRPARRLILTDKLTTFTLTYNNSDIGLATNLSYEIRVTETGRSPATEQIYGSVTLRNK